MRDYSSNVEKIEREKDWQVLSLALASNPLKVLLVGHDVRFVLPPSFSLPLSLVHSSSNG